MKPVQAYVASLHDSAIARAIEGKYDPARPSEASEAVILEIWEKGTGQFLADWDPAAAKEFTACAPEARSAFFASDNVYSFERFITEFVKGALKHEGLKLH